MQLWSQDDPHRGDTILRIGPDGEPNGLVTRVRTIVSYDRHLCIWEVVDSESRPRYIERFPGEERFWLEVEI